MNIRNHSKHKDNFMKSLALDTCFSRRELSELRSVFMEKHFSKNKIILSEEETSDYMYLIHSGSVKAVQISADGKEQILAIHKSGDFFGEMSLLDGKTSAATVIAMEDTRIGLITKTDFTRYFLSKEKVLKQIISLLCSRLRDSWLRLKVLGLADAEQRVRTVLKLLGEQNGIKKENGIVITIKLTHKEIAAYASVSRETATRILDRFLKEGEIEMLPSKNILLKPSFPQKHFI